MRFSTYSNYQETDFYWLGKIPSSWQIKRVGHHTDFITGFAFKSDLFSFEKGIKLVRGDNVTEGSLRWGDKTRFWSEITKELEQYLLKDKDLLIGMDGSKVGKNFTLIKESDLPLLLVQRVARLRTDDQLYYKFLSYLIGSELFRIWVTLVKTDPAIPHISPSDIRGFPLPFPSYEEQTQIAAFLDHETAKIDTLIEKQQQLIELLKEKRQAVISHAVTKGLNPDAPMKDSGVEWLGEVPEHWSVAPLKYLVKEKAAGPYGASLTKAMYVLSGIKVYGQQQVISNDFDIGDYYISENKYKEMTRYTVYPDDVLISVMGTVGKVAVVPPTAHHGIINPRLVRYKFNTSKIKPMFVQHLIMSIRYQNRLSEASQGSTMDGLNMGILGDLSLALPPINEQDQIISEVNHQSSVYNKLINKAENVIILSQERRTALISAAVTGKIDVRHWVVPTTSSDTNKTVQKVSV
ncbi:restriction endonuclease subunit S [Photobacterium sp. S4TG1]|uniref:restriction endonuclease subunit S n=1 Tax=Photobacterium sp. S4TG1 TaxID=3114587 RepID=UPI002E1A0015|nr:restriction endonuclease subunit S [Photobacterium sp. S4TG1]